MMISNKIVEARIIVGAVIGLAFAAQAADIAALVKEDLKNEVRPGGVNGSPFWNANARFFMYPPAFDFPSDANAVRYRFDIVDANGKCHSFDASRPTASLAPVWERLPTGWTSVSCRSIDKCEERHVLKGCRVFWKQAPFTGNYPPASRSYRECADLAVDWIFSQPSWKKFMSTHDATDCGYWGFIYPSKMIAALVRALCGGAADGKRIAAARHCADWLISLSEGPDRPLAYFPPTYHSGDPENAERVVKEYWGQVMLIYPAEFGRALMKLYAVTMDEKYLAQAKGIAETYLRLQGEDGTWFLKMDTKTGKEVKPNRLMPIASAIPFLNTLYEVTGDKRYFAAADRAFAYVENGPLKTWNWEGQFEDVAPDGAYRNLTKHDACATALYICERYPNDKARIAVARDLLRFSEDQFVCWENPFPDYPLAHVTQNVAKWILPGVTEQYYWYVPIDASASKLIRTYLALYRVERNPLDLAKARALGDAMTRMQKPDGDIPTHWHGGETGCSWWNCLLSDVDAMNELATTRAADRPAGASDGRWPGFERGIGMGGWLTNYKRFNVLRNDWRMKLTEGDFEHFESFITERDVAYVAKCGFDHIRLGFDQIVLEEAPGKYRERTFRCIDNFVGWCRRHGLGVVLNLHKAVGNYCDIPGGPSLMDEKGLQDRFVALWQEFERRYHGDKALAFELLNEVNSTDCEKWNALAARTVKAIRATNAERTIVVGSCGGNYPNFLDRLQVFDDQHVVYTFHWYSPGCFTHQQGVLKEPYLYYNRKMSYPSDDVERYRDFERVVWGVTNAYEGVTRIDRRWMRQELDSAFRWQAQHPDKVLWAGEFGTIRHADAKSRAAWMRDMVSICREGGFPYCVWNYLSTPNDGNKFSLVDDDTREFLSQDLLNACLGD